MITNPQRPFAYLPKPEKKPVVPLNIKWSVFPSNYVAMCISCLYPYQKVAKLCKLCEARGDDPSQKPVLGGAEMAVYACCYKCNRRLPCVKCTSAYVKKFIPPLLPWILLPPELPRIYGYHQYLETNVVFHCNLCGVRYGSLAVYSSLCSCKEHRPKTGNFVCRYCCPLVDEKLLRAINKARERLDKEDTPKNKCSLPIQQIPRDLPHTFTFGTRTGRTRFARHVPEPINLRTALYENIPLPDLIHTTDTIDYLDDIDDDDDDED